MSLEQSQIESSNEFTVPPENDPVRRFAEQIASLEKEAFSEGQEFNPELIKSILALSSNEEIFAILESKAGEKYYSEFAKSYLPDLEDTQRGWLYALSQKCIRSLTDSVNNEPKLENIKKTLDVMAEISGEHQNLPKATSSLLKNFEKWPLRKLAGIENKYSQEAIDTAADFLMGYKKQLRFNDRMDQWELGLIFKKNPELSSQKLFTILEKGLASKENIPIAILLLTDLIGAEGTRDKLNNLLHKKRAKKENANQAVIDNLEYARSFITPNHEKIAVESLPDLYENKIKFESYGLNGQMQKKEIALLEGLIKKDQKVLEAGMGTGRLFLELQKAEYDITGFDFTQRHVALVRGEAPDAKVFKGDWKNNALQNESFDAVYSLGRNILHEYSLPDQVQMFREAARILKKGGKFIFDIPDREKKDSEYKQRVDEYADTMRNEFHINNFRHGAIYDSPNGVDFATRYAYSNEDIENLAQLAGFRIAEVRREPLPTGKGDENLYYVLEKI